LVCVADCRRDRWEEAALVEAVLARHPAVQEVCIFGVPGLSFPANE
jgi:AMP-binding enzyme C-terminal domain